MIEPDDVFDQLIKVSRSREQGQGGLNGRFDLQSKVSHTHIKGISEDLAKSGEFGGKHGC